MDNNKNKTCNILKKLRCDMNISQDALAKRLHVTRQAVSRWEMGCTPPNLETLKELSALYGISINELLGGERLPEKQGDPNCPDWNDDPVESITQYNDAEESEMNCNSKKLRRWRRICFGNQYRNL